MSESTDTVAAGIPLVGRWVLRSDLAVIAALVRRAANEILRVPGAAIPGVLAPAIFFVGLYSVFGHLTRLPAYPTQSFQSWLIAVSLLQGAGFTGAATGVNLARDIEQGWFDRLLASPAPRPVLLAGLVSSAALRSLIPATFLLVVGFALGVHWPGVGGLLLAVVLVMGMGTIAACWGCALALKFRSQSAAPLMQAGMLVLILTTTAYAPIVLLRGWLHTVAQVNPATQILDGARQGFVGAVTWGDTWPALLAMTGLIALMALLSLHGMRRTGY